MNLNDVIEREKCVLSAVFRDNSALDKIRAEYGIDTAMFYDPRDQTIFNALKLMRESKMEIDLNFALDFMSDKGYLTKAGGIAYVAEVENKLPSAAGVEWYCDKIVASWKQRESNKILAEAREKIKEGNDPAAVWKEQAEKMKRVLSAGSCGAFKTPSQRKGNFQERLLSDIERKERTGFVGIDCGMYKIDELTGGFQKGDLVIIAANSGGGKTTLAETWLLHMLKNGHKAAFVSLDMGTNGLERRLVSITTKVPLRKFKRADMTKEEAINLINTADYFNGGISKRLFIAGRELADWEKLKPALLNLVRVQGVEIVFIDYAQLITKEQDGRAKDYNLEREVANGLKGLALDLDVPIIALSQTNSNAYSDKAKKEPPKPSLNQLGGGLAFVQPSDFIFILMRDENDEARKSYKAYAVKVRDDDIFDVDLIMDTATLTFKNVGEKPQQ